MVLSRRLISFAAVFIFISTLILNAVSNNAWAYENQSYYKDLKIQLKSMSSSTMAVTLSGSYKMNGSLVSSGTTLNISAGPADMLADGVSYTEIQLVPENPSNTIKINNGTRALSYLGSISLKSENSKVMAYNTISIESYLKGVVPYEMSDYFPSEALKAQAVAARNFALKKIGTKASSGYDFDDTTLFQVYCGYNSKYTNAAKAVEDTKGMVLLYNDQLVEALYSASNGGYTEASENVWGNYVDYLRAKPDTFENELWASEDMALSNQQIESMLKSKGYLKETDSFEKIDISSITKFESGRINQLPVIYKDEADNGFIKYITKESARTFLSLPSSMYNVAYDEADGIYTFSGKGYGHGLGLSQIGAKNRALAGQAFGDILKFYYDGAALATLDTINVDSDSGTDNQTQTSIPEIKLLTQPNPRYKPGETISITAVSPNYNEKVEYRVIIYNGTTKVSTQLYNSPSTGYYNRSGQQAGSSDYLINIPVNNMTPGTYSITVLTRKTGTSVPYDSYVKTNSFVVEALSLPSRDGSAGSLIPKLYMITPPAREYKSGDIISFTVSSPNYGGKVEYRVILYNGNTKKTSELWNTPLTGYYYKNWQPAGNYKFSIHWPVKGMEPGPYSITVLVRRVGSKVPYDSFVKTETIWIRN